MSEDARSLKCPACGATLEPPQGQSSMICSYCKSTIEIPASAQAQAPAPTPHPYNPTLSKNLALARPGERIRAINMVWEVTGNTNLSDAAEIMNAIVRGELVEL